jgi:tetratricopeptide (TPR) repeat protein
MNFHALVLLTLISLLLSCAHQRQAENSDQTKLTAEQVEEINRDALALASDRLKQIVVEAKSNEGTRQYLATDLFLKANFSLMDGDFLTASVLFEHLSTLVPEDEFIQKKYAVALIRVGEMDKSRVVLEKLFKKTKDEKIGLILAGVYTGLDQEPKAQRVYRELLAMDPQNEDACVFLSKSYAIEKKESKAISLLQTCARHDPKNGMYDYYLGKIHLDAGKLKEARAAFKKSHERQPDFSQAVNALGVIYEEEEKYNEAISLYKKHLEKNQMDNVILSRMVHALFLKERYKEVIPYAERLSDIEPDNLNLKVKLGILYTDAKQYPEALSVFKELLQSAPQSDKILYYMGAIHQEMQDWQQSIEYFNQIPTSSALYSDSSIQMANMLSTLAQEEMGEDKTESNWKEAFLKHVNGRMETLKDLRLEFSVIKAGFYESIGSFKEAMDTMMVVQDEKNFGLSHKYYLANLFEKEKRFEESTALIMGIIEKEPKNAHAWNFLGYSMLMRGNEMDKAFEFIQKAKAISPNDGYIRDSLGWYYYKKGEVKKALVELQAALKQVPDDIEILKHLAIVHQEMKDFIKAKNFWESALKHARYKNDRQEILSRIEALEKDRIPASQSID